MRNRYLLILLAISLLLGAQGCQGQVVSPSSFAFSSPTATLPPSPEPDISPSVTPNPPTYTATKTVLPPTTTHTPRAPTATSIPVSPTPTVELPFTLVRLSLNQGDLAHQLAEEAIKAKDAGEIPVVYFDAPW
jgi:hypothetical protein